MARPPNGIRSLPISWRVLGSQHGFVSRIHHKRKAKWREVWGSSKLASGLAFALAILIILLTKPDSGAIGSTRRFIEPRSKSQWTCGCKNIWLPCLKTLLGNVLGPKSAK